MLRKLEEKDESKKGKDDNIDDKTKEVEINEVAEVDSDKLVADAVNDAPPPQDTMTTTMAAAAEEGGDNNDVGAEEGGDDVVVPALLSGGCHSSSHGVLRRRSVVHGISDKFVAAHLCDLVDIHLLGLVVNVVVLPHLGFVLLL